MDISIPLEGPGSPDAPSLDEKVEVILLEALRLGELTKEVAEEVRRMLAA